MSEADEDHRVLVRAVGLALCGDEVAAERVPAGGSPAACAADALADAGWDAARLQEFRRSRQLAGQSWPLPVDRGLLAQVGFARFHAVVVGVRELLGLDGLVPTRHVGPKVIGPAEQRLLADVPPHHGNVG